MVFALGEAKGRQTAQLEVLRSIPGQYVEQFSKLPSHLLTPQCHFRASPGSKGIPDVKLVRTHITPELPQPKG